MSVAIVDTGYRKVVLPMDKAMQLIDLLAEAEIYETKYHRNSKDEPSHKTHHIYKEANRVIEMMAISDEHYEMYKLAGKPAE
jgi:hypothetical protein